MRIIEQTNPQHTAPAASPPSASDTPSSSSTSATPPPLSRARTQTQGEYLLYLGSPHPACPEVRKAQPRAEILPQRTNRLAGGTPLALPNIEFYNVASSACSFRRAEAHCPCSGTSAHHFRPHKAFPPIACRVLQYMVRWFSHLRLLVFSFAARNLC